MSENPASLAECDDVVIIGAGPAGLSLACALADAGLSTRVLEQQGLAALETPAPDGREIALTHRSRRLMTDLGLWDGLPPDLIAPLHEARVLDGERAEALRFEAPRGAVDPLGWLVPNHLIRAAAHAAARRRPRIRIQCDARVTALTLGADRASVTLAGGGRVDAALVVAADSRFSQARRLAGIGAAMRDFGRSVIVACVAHDKPNEGIAWECFRYGNTLALLPMNQDRSSVVVTVPASAAPGWLDLPEAEFAARIESQAGGRLGAMRLVGERHHYPLVSVYAHRFAAQRFALIGDAAVGMHPVTAHGWNLGLQGVETLVGELAAAHAAGRDIGAHAPLAAFERAHRRATWPTYVGTNALATLFSDESTPAKFARRAVLDLAGHLPLFSGLVKSLITRQLTGDRANSGPHPLRLRPLTTSKGTTR